MRNRTSNFIMLFGSLFFSIIGALITLVVIFLLIRLFFGVLSYIPWITYVYVLVILLFPAVILLSVFYIFFKRTLKYPIPVVKWISLTFFSLVIIAWIVVLIADLTLFFKKGFSEIDPYYSYNVLFLFVNIAGIFLIGTLQALALPAEKDWMEKRRELHPEENQGL